MRMVLMRTVDEELNKMALRGRGKSPASKKKEKKRLCPVHGLPEKKNEKKKKSVLDNYYLKYTSCMVIVFYPSQTNVTNYKFYFLNKSHCFSWREESVFLLVMSKLDLLTRIFLFLFFICVSWTFHVGLVILIFDNFLPFGFVRLDLWYRLFIC